MSEGGLSRLPETDPTTLLRPRDGIYAVDLLAAAVVEFRLLDSLATNPATFDKLCRRFDWAERPADVLVTLMKSYGLVAEDGDGVLSATLLAQEHFCEGSPWDLTDYYKSLRDRPVVADFVEVLRTGRPAHWAGLDGADEDWHGSMLSTGFAENFTAAMDCRGVFLGKALADAVPELSSHTRLLDVGGGSAVYACALVANYPHLVATVLEQEPVASIARRRIAERGFVDRIEVRTADLFSETWLEGHDALLFSNVIHDWDKPEIGRLLRAARAAISERGLLLVHEAFLNRDKTGPRAVAEYSCILAHSTQGRCYSVGEIETFLDEAGFSFLEHRDTGGDRGVILAEPTT